MGAVAMDTELAADRPDWRRWAAWSIAVIAALCYANAIANGYVQDDQGIIHDNPLVKSISGLWAAWVNPYWPKINGAGQYRPLVIASFSFDHAVLHLGVWWIHLVNIAWHVGVCLLVWRVLLIFLDARGAWFGSIWFALHPVHVEAVSNGVGRCELMATAFVLLAFLAHRDGRRTAVLWYAAALASKESGIVFLGLAALNDVLMCRDWRAALRERRRLYAEYAGVTALYAVTLYAIFHNQKLVIQSITWDHATTLDRWFTMLRCVPEVLRLILMPLVLRGDYTPRTIDLVTTVTPAVVFGLVLLVASLVLVVVTWRRAPAIAFGILWFDIAFSPVSNILFPSGIVLAERTLYLPSVGAAIIAGWLFQRAVEVRPRLVPVLAGVLCVTFAVRTWTRTPYWHDKRQFLIWAVKDQPETARIHYSVGVLYLLERHWADAVWECQVARHLYPWDLGPYVTGAEAEVARKNFDAAAVLLDSAKHIDPSDYATLFTLAQVRRLQGHYREAIALALSAYETSPDSVSAIDELTSAAQKLNDFVDADAAFRRALADHPKNAHLHQSYAGMLADRGDTAAARYQLQMAAGAGISSLFAPQPATPTDPQTAKDRAKHAGSGNVSGA